ncbi:MAG TPA: LPXTG cell wall anchor domain-containing protein [Acidimicrobiia bacterium]|nr:LPXTG cell wall anchor domain-containing protein [Acidimicrobiia bacterium]
MAGLRRARRRRWAVAIVTGTVLMSAALVALAVPASAHRISGMTANCTEVVVTFADFPPGPTPVHIAIQVGSAGSTSADVSVTDTTPPKHVDITSLTSKLQGESADVVVDVTWRFDDKDNHDHGSFPVTCGTHSTSTSSVSPATTSQKTSTSTSVPVTVTTGGEKATTSTSIKTSTSVPVSVAGESTSTSISVSPETASMPSTTSAVKGTSTSSLPFTGGSSLPLLVVGVALLLGGAAAVLAPRRRRSSES